MDADTLLIHVNSPVSSLFSFNYGLIPLFDCQIDRLLGAIIYNSMLKLGSRGYMPT